MRLALALPLLLLPGALHAQACGGDFDAFVDQLESEAVSRGYPPATVDSFFDGIRRDESVIRADRAQGVFTLPFLEFSQRLISQNRLNNGQAMSQRHDAVFDEIERRYGVSRGVLLAFWAFETDYGQVQGDYNTANALVTLAHDCRRPELFRPQVFAALEMYENGDLDPDTTTGAWAGEIGMVQLLPAEIVEKGVDGDGDGHVDLNNSVPDALFSGAAVLRSLGWEPDQPWLQEVTVPQGFDWSRSGLDTTLPGDEWAATGVSARGGEIADLPASLIVPQGRRGPAFLAYPNYKVLFEWNESFVYVTTAAYFATRLEGAPVYEVGDPSPGLGETQMKDLQRKLQERGHDVGEIDGILGSGTRAAVQAEQERLGLPADAWPTQELLSRL